MSQVEEQIKSCIEKQQEGKLSKEDLEAVLDHWKNRKTQTLLYLFTNHSTVMSDVIAMNIITKEGQDPGPEDEEDWPYKTVHAAMQDGWRVIRFPEMAMQKDYGKHYMIGCEFVLEKVE
ncbi:MAG: hypothetical protein HRT89_19700 [Lentisphaeria bacterium]|nr:hypothetical protein [Lentisphaeria bacterium]NQZ70282.1 hypothetical protein [Lentisphaeria bacterium]